MSSVTTPYLGSKIVLYTKSAIRYEGTLYSIDTKESTVALAKVRSFGTETRPTDRPVGASNKIYEYVIFKGNEIQDIYVCQPPRPQPMLEGGLPNDPAIVQHSATGSSGAATSAGEASISTKSIFPSPPHAGLFPTQQPGFNKTEPTNVMDILFGSTRGDRAASKQGRRDSAPQLGPQGQRRFSGQQNWNRDVPRFYRGRGRNNYQQNRGGPRGFTSDRSGDRRTSTGSGFQPGRPTKPKETIKFETEFDFEEANEQFKDVLSKFEKVTLDDKEKAPTADGDESKDEVEEGEIRDDVAKVDEPEAFYDKSKSFFDKISCNAVDSMKDKNVKRPDWKAEKKVNIETFGASGSFNSGRGRRGGYQRGRGGSGGYYRGRGGYNMSSNGFNQGGFSGGNGYSNGFGRYSRENPPAFMNGRRQSTPGSFEQQFRWGGWGQQQQGRGTFRGRRGRQWANNTIF